MNSFVAGLIVGLFIGSVVGVFAMALCVASRDNVTVTYSGYQPKIDNSNLPAGAIYSVDDSDKMDNDSYAIPHTVAKVIYEKIQQEEIDTLKSKNVKEIHLKTL